MTPEQKAAEYADEIWKGYEDVFSKAVIDKGSEAYKQAFLSGAHWQRENGITYVSDGMPDDDVCVLGYAYYDRPALPIFRHSGNWFYQYKHDYVDVNIIAWQPMPQLPTPPKTQEDGNL